MKIYEPVWVQDIEASKADRYIRLSEKSNPKLRYFTGEAKEPRPGIVGMYHQLRPGYEP
jgi:hypothetical protein